MPMAKNLTLEQTYDKCMSDGNLINLENADINKIKSIIEIFEEKSKAARILLDSKEPVWNSIYESHYGLLHLRAEAFLLFDKIKSLNHVCLFSYLCLKHPELEFN